MTFEEFEKEVEKVKEAIFKFLNPIVKNIDKIIHFLITYSITISFALHGYWILGTIISIALSLMKELLDKWLYNGFSWGDICADIMGILVSLLVYLVSVI